jgi:hypothetical protein
MSRCISLLPKNILPWENTPVPEIWKTWIWLRARTVWDATTGTVHSTVPLLASRCDLFEAMVKITLAVLCLFYMYAASDTGVGVFCWR